MPLDRKELGVRALVGGVKRRYTGGEHGWVGDNPIVYLSAKKFRSLGWRLTIPPQEAIRLTACWTIDSIQRQSKDNGQPIWPTPTEHYALPSQSKALKSGAT